ncbi:MULTISPECIES: tRNA (adenosine(37)-N6)-threonylcarbamoyltransferase complex dimerization subunit type 1 TsaB [Anaerococcus]|uniref:tRNA (adenosine(37)-N6)-threonylcarbamoyltransferase complex dimerization subunit type 1 TsaB n=1 Tax=Anaerococcus TaxID=165779 RepID=UPI0027BA96D8|nr:MULTISPECIES: tRNA (adenosine(37)-N6)-threonylcarbamoyltransferase complex dimerization subunit type 1 TsaB [Anaerococcus]MDU2598567.1 tRNA (adenosine(37)-N6)-threonylcarbamoyltransferase complex dimerization subunit type 1 TsaB [Anaerococcus sp.]MDU5534784.1 tRNA (adenosine(37)-N6)-threonylcarbamoyltransferase complex dimerization subunit type 1 TsaB [Anaerococcus sp.]MDU7411033.1 tRNA (adenosine(37)-N6)-threonylcarbamoyltransferase complex dimerization subunit type 1 TsaB [Anaerococcus sp.]
MNILAIDTSTMISTVTIASENEILGDFNVNQQKTHSESLVPMIETLLNLLGMEIKDIDEFVIAEGPGSFTGLRIGMTIAKTLAQVNDRKLVPISTLLALANNSSSDKLKVPMLDARGNRVYGAVYDKEFNEIIKEDLYTIEDFSKLVNDLDKEIELIGDISLKYQDLFEKAKVLPINFRNTIGKSLIKLALENKNDYDLYQLVPNYLRKSQAERELLRNDQKNGN